MEIGPELPPQRKPGSEPLASAPDSLAGGQLGRGDTIQRANPLAGYCYEYPLLAPGRFGCRPLDLAELAVAVRVELREQLLASFRIWPALSA